MMWTDEQVRRATRETEDTGHHETGILATVLILSVCLLLYVLGDLPRDETAVLRHRCDQHGGIFRAATDGGRIIAVTCRDGWDFTR